MSTPVVYRAYGESGNLLYVGSSITPGHRLSAHEGKEWWGEVAFVKLSHFASRAEAREAEARAIHTEGPTRNRLGIVVPPRRRRRTEPRFVVSLCLSPEEHAFLKEYADRQQRSVSGQVRFMVAQLRAEELETRTRVVPR